MSTSTDTTIKAAMAVAKDVAEGRLDPADLDAMVAEESRAAFGTAVGPDDPLWPVQVHVARQVLALGGVPADELSEWAAVARRRQDLVRAVEASEKADRHIGPSEAETSASGPHSLGNGSLDTEPET